MRTNKFNKFIVPLLAGTLVGCGMDSAPSDNDIAARKPAPEAYPVDITAVDGLIVNGDVIIFDYSQGTNGDVLGTGKTDSFGALTTTISGIDETQDQVPVKACVRTGTYTEEASGAQIALQDDQELCAVTFFEPNAENQFSVVINPLSHYASGLASFKISEGQGIATAIIESNTAFGDLAGYDILSTIPRDATSTDHLGKPYDNQMQMAYQIAGISQMTLDIAEEQGLSRHNPNFSSIAYHQIMHNDIASDGVFNGSGLAQNGVTTVSLGMGTRQFDRNTPTLDVAKSTIDFVQSDKNKAGIEVEEMLAEQERIASNTSSILEPIPDGEPLPTLDGDAPVITFNLTEGQYISGELVVSGSISDFSGVKSVVVTIGGVDYPQQPELNFSHSIMTDGDGPLDITVTAIDLLNNSGTANIGVQLANSIPVSNMTSSLLGNNTNYQFTAQLTNYDQGVTSITANGVTASIDADGVIAADLSLTQGNNPIELVVNDGVGVSHTYNYSVAVDTTNPTAVFDRPNLASGYEVFYKDFALTEPYLGDLKYDKTGHPFYIDQFHVSLNGQSISEANLEAQNWAYIKFTPTDPATEGNDYVATDASDLVVTYQYIQGSSAQPVRSIVAFDAATSTYIIPLATEFLIDDWEQYEGQHSLVINIADGAGNTNAITLEFLTYDSIPSLSSDIDADTWFSNESNTLGFDSTDFTGVDTVEFVIGGVTYTSNSLTNPQFVIDPTLLTSGLNVGLVKAYKDGVLVINHEVQMSVDNTGASLVLTSPEYHNNSEYVVSGTVLDAESGIDSVLVDGLLAAYDLFSNSFTKSLTGLTEGLHSYDVKAINNAGLETDISKALYIDLTTPLKADQYPSPANPYQVSYQNNLLSASSDAELQLLNDSSIFYFTHENIHLDSNLPTVSYLRSKKIPFVMFDVTDSFSNGAGTANDEIVVTYNYSVDGVTLFEDKGLTSATNEFILPITKEYLTEDFFNVSEDKLHLITFNINDKAGNTLNYYTYFKLSYKPADLTILSDSGLIPNYANNTELLSDSNSDIEVRELTLKNDNFHDVNLILNGESNIDYTHVKEFGRLYATYSTYNTYVFKGWVVENLLGVHPSYSNVDVATCKQESFVGDLAINGAAGLNFSIINASKYDLVGSHDGYIDNVPTDSSPVSTANPWVNYTNVFYYQSGASKGESINGFIFDVSKPTLCVNGPLFTGSGSVSQVAPHVGASVSNTAVTVTNPTAMMESFTFDTHVFSNNTPTNVVTDVSTPYSLTDVSTDFSVEFEDLTTGNYIDGQSINVKAGETIKVKVNVRNPVINTSGSSCVFDANGEYCDKSYAYQVESNLTLDTLSEGATPSTYRVKPASNNTLNRNTSR